MVFYGSEANAGTTPIDSAQNSLLNYGAIGAILVLCLIAIIFLFKYVINSHARERAEWLTIRQEERAAHREREDELNARADKLDAEVQKLNDAFREKYTAILGEATRAVTDALDVVRELRRNKRRDDDQ